MPRSYSDKIAWSGVVTSVQPRIRLNRSFDQRSHSYLGYNLRIDGTVGDDDDDRREFMVAVGKAAHGKHQFQVGDVVSGEGLWVEDARKELAELYKVSKLKVTERFAAATMHRPPPWLGVPPELPVYRERGHRRLASRTFDTKCDNCIWGCRMPVEMIIDHWNPSSRRYRFETHCYGPKSCKLYKAGPPRKVPGRRGMSWTEDDWVDEESVRHRGMDE